MLALFACVTRFASASIIVNLVDALTVVATRLGRTLVDVGFAGRAAPSRMTDALVAEELVYTDAVQAGVARAEVDFLVAAFAGEAGRAVAGEVGNQVSTVGAEQARSLGAIVGVDFAALTFPARRTIALVTALLKSHASSAVVARISTGRARIYLEAKVELEQHKFGNKRHVARKYTYGDVAIDSGVAGPAETGVVVISGLVLAHGPLWTRIVGAV